jgi:hypothetical protein
MSKTLPISAEPSPAPRGAYTIREFAEAHGISESMFFKLHKQGLAPVTMWVGTRRLISIEAAARWRAEREAAATPEAV